MSFFSSVEFYVIMAVVAAAIVALAARPRTPGAVKEFLLGSRLIPMGDDPGIDLAPDMPPDTPAIEFRCLPDGTVKLTRNGLSGITTSGAVSLAVKYDGVNVRIEERLTPGSDWQPEAVAAVFNIDFLPPGRYHVQFNSGKTGLFVAFSLHVRQGIVATRLLQH